VPVHDDRLAVPRGEALLLLHAAVGVQGVVEATGAEAGAAGPEAGPGQLGECEHAGVCGRRGRGADDSTDRRRERVVGAHLVGPREPRGVQRPQLLAREASPDPARLRLPVSVLPGSTRCRSG
jgi:hypothetical protein